MFLQEGSIFPSPPTTVLLSVTTHSHNTRLKFHTELLILAPWIQASLKNIHLVQIQGSFLTTWLPPQAPVQVTATVLPTSKLFPLDLSWCSPRIQISVCCSEPQSHSTSAQSPTKAAGERVHIYIHKYQLIDIEEAITSWPKVIAAMFLCAICLFQSLLKKQPLTNSHINPSARQTMPNLLLLEAIAVVDLNPRPSSSRKLLCIRNTCKSLVDCAQKCWEQQTFSSDQ